MAQKSRGGWNEVNFEKNAGVVRVGWGNNGKWYQSYEEHDNFRSARDSAEMSDMGSDTNVHFPVQRAFLRKK